MAKEHMSEINNKYVSRRTAGGLEHRVITLRCRDLPEFVLFPMIHVADRSFYENVMSNADRCDVVLYEGVKSAAAQSVRKICESVAKSDGKLTVQPAASQVIGGRWRISDISSDEFKQSWTKIPLRRRLMFYVLLFVVRVAMRFIDARKLLIEPFSSEEVPGNNLESVFGPELRKILLDKRDATLLSNCEELIAKNSVNSIAVVWGAGHIPQLAKSLMLKHGYTVDDAVWFSAIKAESTTELKGSINVEKNPPRDTLA